MTEEEQQCKTPPPLSLSLSNLVLVIFDGEIEEGEIHIPIHVIVRVWSDGEVAARHWEATQVVLNAVRGEVGPGDVCVLVC